MFLVEREACGDDKGMEYERNIHYITAQNCRSPIWDLAASGTN